MTDFILTQATFGSFTVAARHRIAVGIVAGKPIWPCVSKQDDHHKLKLALFEEIRRLMGVGVNPRYAVPTPDDVQAAQMLWPVRARKGEHQALYAYRASLRYGGPFVETPLGAYLAEHGLPPIPNITVQKPANLDRKALRELDNQITGVINGRV